MATTDSAPGARNTDYAQALALAGLLAGASLSLSRLYAGNAWLLPTWLTMAAALGLAALLRRLGVGQLLALLAMVGGFLVVGGILLFPDTLLLVVPTGRTLTEMAAAASTALTAVSEQAAPVQVTTEFVLLTCAGAWAVATAADGLAFRARQPLLALVPALGLFVFPAVIRPSSPAWYTAWFLLGAAGMLLFEGRARLATWGRWVSSARSRPGAGWRLPLTPAAQTGRWLALAAGLCALTVPWLLPGYGQQAVLDLKEGAGSDAGVALNPFISLRTRLTAQEDVPTVPGQDHPARALAADGPRPLRRHRLRPLQRPPGQPGPLPGPDRRRAGPRPAGDPGHPGGRDPGAGLVLAAGGHHPHPGRRRPAGAGQPDASPA